MRLLWCCILSAVVMATGYPHGTMDNYYDPQNIDTPDDDQDVGQGGNANPQGNPQAGSSYFVPTTGDSSSSSSSSEEEGSMASVPIGGSVPPGTVGPGGSPVVGNGATGGNAAGAGVQGGGAQGGARGGGNNADQDSGEQSPGGSLLHADPSFLSKVQAQPKGNSQNSGSAGKSAGIAIGVLGLVSVATVGIILAIRKKRDGFMRFYSQASNEL